MPFDDVYRVIHYWSTLAAAAVSGFLCIFVLVRSPRNLFTLLYCAMTLCVFEWNFIEWVRINAVKGTFLHEETYGNQCAAIGYTILPALFFHFVIRLAERMRRVLPWVLLVYGGAFALLIPPVGGMVLQHEGLTEFFTKYWRGVWLVFFGPVMATAFVLLGRRYVSTPPRSRGIFGFPLLAAAILFFPGPLEWVEGFGRNIPWMANLASAVTSVVLAIGVFKHSEVFDSISRLRESTADLFRAMNRGWVTFDYRGAAIFSNSPASALIGHEPKSIDDMQPEVRSLFRDGGQRYIKQGPRVLKATVLRVDSPVQEASHIHLILEDSTREYQLLHDLAQRESLASLGEAAATLAHEIRNPLTTLRATIETLSRESEVDPAKLGRLEAGVNRLTTLMDRSLDLARPLEIDRQKCDLNQLIRKVVDRFERGGEIGVSLKEGIPLVYVDPDLVGQVLVNLLRNAVEAGAGKIQVTTASDGRSVSIRVRDEGPPIPPEVLGRLFQPFVTTKADGTGLGLALCRKIVTAHGGRIDAKNLPDGVELEVRLPWKS